MITPHPRLSQTAADLARQRRDAEEVAAGRRRADDFLAKTKTTGYPNYSVSLPEPEMPRRHPEDHDWPYWTGLCGELRGGLQAMSRAFALTGEEKYYDGCRKLMLAISRWDSWTDPDYGKQPCLDTFSLTTGMAVAYDYLYDKLSEGDRRIIRGAIVQKGVLFTLRHADDPKSYVHHPRQWPNGYAMTNVGMGMGALAVLGEEPDAPAWVRRAIEQANLYFDQEGGKDGGLIEGMSYGSAAVDPLMQLVVALRQTTGESLMEHAYLKRAIEFPVYFMAPGERDSSDLPSRPGARQGREGRRGRGFRSGKTVVNFGDNGGPSGCRPVLIETARTLAALKGDGLASWYLGRTGQHDARTRGVPEASPTGLPAARLFSTVNWAALRTGWGEGDVLLAFKSGVTRNHNHRDQNSFVVAYRGEWLANDPGYQRYDMEYPDEKDRQKIRHQHLYTSGTVGHNTLLADGEGQGPEEGKIDRFENEEGFAYLRGDATACYAPKLSRAHRYLAVVRSPDAPGGGWFVLWDDVATSASLAFLLHTDPKGVFTLDGRPAVEGKPVSAAEVTIDRDHGRLSARFLTPVEVTPLTYADSGDYGHYVSATRPGAAQAGFVVLLWAGPKEGATGPEDPKVEGDPGSGAFRVTWSASGKAYGVRFDRSAGKAFREP